MLIHFLNSYNVTGKIGNRIKIRGKFPGMHLDDFVFLNRDDDYYEEEQAYKIEQIEYSAEENDFKAVIAAE